MGWYLGWYLSTLVVSYGLLVAHDSPRWGVRFGARLTVLVCGVVVAVSGVVALAWLMVR